MLTTYIALTVITHTGSYWAGFAAALAAGLVLGAVIERVVIRPVENKPPLNAVVVTIGLLVFLEGIAGIIYGGQYRSFPAAFSVTGLHAGSVPLGISRNDLFVAAAVLVAALALAALFRYTSAGLRLRATAFNAYAARLLGVRVGRVLTLGWALAGLIGALAGLLVSPDTFLYPSSMDSIFVLGFTAAVIGGLDSPVGRDRGRAHPRRGAQLRRRLPRLQPGADLRARRAHHGADAPPVRAVLRESRPAGVTMTLLRHLVSRDRGGSSRSGQLPFS